MNQYQPNNPENRNQMKKPTQFSLCTMNDVATSGKEMNDIINELVSFKPMILRISKIMADLEKLTNPRIRLPQVNPNGKKPS